MTLFLLVFKCKFINKLDQLTENIIKYLIKILFKKKLLINSQQNEACALKVIYFYILMFIRQNGITIL